MGNCNSNPTEGCDNSKVVEELTDFYKGVNDLLIVTNTKFKEVIDAYTECCTSTNDKLTDIKIKLHNIVDDADDCCDSWLANLQRIIDELNRVVDPDYVPVTTEEPVVPDYYSFLIKYGLSVEDMCEGVVTTVYTNSATLDNLVYLFDSPALNHAWTVATYIMPSPYTGLIYYLVDSHGKIVSKYLGAVPVCEEADTTTEETPGTEEPVVQSGVFALNNDFYFICEDEGLQTLFYIGDWHSAVMYIDAELENEMQGFTFIRKIGEYTKRSINPVTGKVGALVGICS
jgi:hypothetical protein